MTEPVVPRVQHRIWFNPPMPEVYESWVSNWLYTHPSWQHFMWEKPPAPMFNQELFDNAADISPVPYQFQSDILRYELLYQYGGVYLDVDFQPLKPIDDLLTAHPEGFVIKIGQWVNNAVIAIPPKDPLMMEAIQRLPDNVRKHAGRTNTYLSGPQFFTPLVRAHSFTELDEHLFHPYDWTEIYRHGEEFPDSYAIHAWNNQRVKKGRTL